MSMKNFSDTIGKAPLLSNNINNDTKIKVSLLFCMGVKLGLLH